VGGLGTLALLGYPLPPGSIQAILSQLDRAKLILALLLPFVWDEGHVCGLGAATVAVVPELLMYLYLVSVYTLRRTLIACLTVQPVGVWLSLLCRVVVLHHCLELVMKLSRTWTHQTLAAPVVVFPLPPPTAWAST
jgi:hypothetical protein